MKKANINNNNISDDFPFHSTLLLTVETPSIASTIFTAIHPETMVDISSRGKTNIFLKNDKQIQFEFIAKDFVSLRAMLGSFLRWIDVVLSSRISLEIK
ncbi:MAG: KEOPS complex subunit Pcc1 [Asgard group archaeon]|nr:KEOPS complex subunit Pcc1 [Asgard group archaeon]